MTQVSRPLLVALAAAVLLLGVWVVALKPSGSGTAANPAPSAPGVKGLANAVDKAHAAVAASNAASAAHGGTVAPTSTLSTPSATTTLASGTPITQAEATAREASQPAAKPEPNVRPAAPATGTPTTRLDTVSRALQSGKVLALLFYSPSSPDDQGVLQELQSVPVLGGRVVKLAIPISELSSYPVVTTQVPISESPTLVIVNGAKQATTIVGFADTLEITQRISDAVA